MVVSFCLVGSLIAGWFVFRPGDPLFYGKPESVWISEIKYGMSMSDDETKEQVERWKQFGPEGLQVLRRGLRNANPTATRVYRRIYRRISPKLPRIVLKMLPAFPQDKGQGARMCILDLLCRMSPHGDEARDAVARALWDEHPHVRQTAINFFIWGENDKSLINRLPEAEKEKLLPAFLNAVEDSRQNWGLRNNALMALRCYTNGTTAITPALVNALQDPSPQVRIRAAEALNRVNQDAARKAGAVSFVVEALKNPDDQIAYQAANALRRFANEPQIAVPALVGALKSTNTLVACEAVWALQWSFQEHAEQILPAMREAAQRKDNVGGYAKSAVSQLEKHSRRQKH